MQKKKENLYAKGVATLSQATTMGRRTNTPEENIEHLRSLLSVDLLLDPFDQDQALEFLDAVENDISKERAKQEEEIAELNEKLDEPKWADLLQKVKDNLDDEKAEELLELVDDQDSDLIYDKVKDKGFVYVRINSMVDEQKLRAFIEREIYPSYNEQEANILF